MNNLVGNAESDILSRIKAARSTEPSTEQEAEPVEPTAESEEQTPVEPEAMADDEAEVIEDEGSNQESEDFYVTIDDEELSFDEIRQLKQGNLRQSDYTRKTQELAEQRKKLEATQEAFEAKQLELTTNIVELEALIGDKQESIDWDELREYDPSEYLKQKELQEKREKALEKAKSQHSQNSQQQSQEMAGKQLEQLIKNNPTWVKDGQETEAYKNDMKLVQDYLEYIKVPKERQEGLLVNGHGQAYIDAAKFHAGKQKNAAIAKKVRQAPVVTKPSGASKSNSTIALEKAIARHKKEASVQSAMALRKAQRQFNT